MVQRRVQLECSSLIVKVGVEATCLHFNPWHIWKETTKLAGPFGTMPQEPWHPSKGTKLCCVIQLNCGEVHTYSWVGFWASEILIFICETTPATSAQNVVSHRNLYETSNKQTQNFWSLRVIDKDWWSCLPIICPKLATVTNLFLLFSRQQPEQGWTLLMPLQNSGSYRLVNTFY